MLLVGEILPLGLWIGKAIECCKWSLVGLASRSMEGSMLRDMWTIEAQLKKFEKNTISNWTRDHSYILEKNVTDFCPCPKIYPGV